MDRKQGAYPSYPVLIVVKPDVETSDDLQLAELEIEGLTGCAPTPLASSPRLPEAFSPEISRLTAEGHTNDHIYVSNSEHGIEPLIARAGFTLQVITLDADNITESFGPNQIALERSSGAPGLKGQYQTSPSRLKNEYLTHAFHKYKAKFFPRMARALINYTTPGSGLILDPFVGSGTLSLEAALMGLPSIGIDLDPLSAIIAKIKVDALQMPTEILEKARRRLASETAMTSGDGTLFDLEGLAEQDYELPSFIGRKMAQPTRLEIEANVRNIKAIIESHSDPAGRAWLRLALSHALATKISLRWMGTGDNRFALAIARRPIQTIMLAHLIKMEKALLNRDGLVSAGRLDPMALGNANIWRADARRLPIVDASVDSVVTSPPYMPAASGRETYLRSRACSLIALDLMTESEVIAQEEGIIGSILRTADSRASGLPSTVSDLVEWMLPQRARRPKALASAAYFLDLQCSLAEIARVLRPGAKMAMVVAAEHVFYELESREIVRRVSMPDAIAELIATREIPLSIDRVVKIRLPKMDYAARPAAQHEYAEAIVIAHRE